MTKPQKKTAAVTAAASTNSSFESDRAAHFPAAVIAAAQESATDTGCPAAVTLAQWALESAYGKQLPEGSNNPFGIKAHGNQPFVLVPTKEWTHEGFVTIKAKFRKFASLTEAFDAHGRLLMDPHGPYHEGVAVWNRSRDSFKFVDAIAHVYATDPKYGEKLRSIIGTWKLLDFNKQPAV